MKAKCAGCGHELEIGFRESLEPYTITMCLEPAEGRRVSAETVGGTLSAFSGLLKSCGRELDQETEVTPVAMDIDNDTGVVRIKVCAVPIRRSGNDVK